MILISQKDRPSMPSSNPPPQSARQGAGSRRVHQLVELDLAVWRLNDNNGVLELDEILLLQLEDLLAHLLGLLLRREGNENQVAHRCSPSVLIVRPVSPLLASRSLRLGLSPMASTIRDRGSQRAC